MWDEILAEVAGDVVGSFSKKDDKGITRTVQPPVAPCGDLTDENAWLEACKGGAKITEKGKTDTGVTVTRSVKELPGKLAVKAGSKLFGVSVKPKAKPKGKEEGTESEEDTALETAKR